MAFLSRQHIDYLNKLGLFLLIGLLILLPASQSLGLPEAQEVVSGEVIFSYPEPTILQINASDKAIINYNSFNIGVNESVIINLPQIDSQLLNRVLGESASMLLGNLTANGIVILVNEKGIVFGPNANIDAAGLIASTRDITNSNFLSSKHIFNKLSQEQLDALLLNQGSINIRQGGFAAFIAGAIENQGAIVCPLGTIALAGGDMVTLDISGNGLISVAINRAAASVVLDYQGNPVTNQLKNSGALQADGGMVLLKAESIPGVFNYAINLDGHVRADRLENKDGSVQLISSGKILVNGQINATKILVGESDQAIAESIQTTGSGKLSAEELISVLAKALGINTASASLKVYKPDGIKLTSSILNDNLIALEGENIRLTYLSSTNLTLEANQGVHTTPGVIIQANQVRIIAREVGTLAVPVKIKAGLTNINRTQGSIEILESTGLGSSIMLRGPPEGFGAIIYDQNTHLVLETQKGDIYLHQGVNLSASALTLTANGKVVSYATIQTPLLYESGETFVLSGTSIIGRAYLQNLDNAVDISGNISGTYSDVVNINFTGNLNLIGNTTLQADADGNQSGKIIMNGYSITGNNYNLSLYSGENTTLDGNISGVAVFELYSSSANDKTYTSTAATFSVNTLKTNYRAIFSRNETSGADQLIFSVSNAIGGLQYIQNNLAGSYRLANNIDASETSSWNSGSGFSPVGDWTNYFTGAFAGANYTITGLYINQPATSEPVGLVGGLGTGGQISNLGLINVGITGYDYVGGLVGYNEGSTITNSYATGSVSGSGNNYVGGLVGYNEGGAITNSYATGSVSGTNIVGGLVGYNSGTITGSYSTGSVTASIYFGGLVGQNTGTLTNSHYNIDTVLINGGNYVTRGGIYNAQYQDWVTDRTLNITDYSANLPYNSGTGYYQVGSVAGLKDLLGFSVSNYRFKLTADIDLSLETNFYIPYFSALEFDGNNKIISNLNINMPLVEKIGFFGYVAQGEIKNLGLTNVNVTGNSIVGGLVGYNSGTITNSYATGSVSGTNTVGGLVGQNAGTITNSYATTSVSGTSSVGGLAGSGNAGSAITNSYATGNVSGAGNYFGGLVGDNSATITNSYATGSVSGTSNVGGLAGYNSSSTTTNSYATGSVTGTTNVGGLVGQAAAGSITNSYATGSVSGNGFVGGLVGYNNYFSGIGSNISNSYAAGSVSGSSNVGGLVGSNNGGAITNSYWDTQTSGRTSSAGGTGKTTAQMKQQATFTGWDFAVVGNGTIGNWIMAGYPHLQFEHTTTITNVIQLQLMAVNLTASYTLANNIDASATANWNWNGSQYLGFAPVGNAANNFRGTFAGANYTITSLYINRPAADYVGLFGYTASTVQISNLGLLNVDITGNTEVGGLVGWKLYGSISNSYVSGSVRGTDYVGGLVGDHVYGTITNSYATGSVSGTGDVGGLVGWNKGTITNSYATGSVSGSGWDAGGLAGANWDGTISNSYATGSVSGENAVGGLVGYNHNTITNSYSTGNVSGTGYVGGLVGYNWVSAITNSYSTGSASGASNVGGLVGYNDGGTISNSYWDLETSGQASSSGGEGKTTAQMMQGATFSGWDFSSSAWNIIEEATYPYLQWRYPYSVSGRAYQDRGTTDIGSGATVSLVINGSAINSASTNASGRFYFLLNSNNPISSADAVLVYINGHPTYAGNTITLANTSNITGLDIYGSALIARHENAGPITNATFSSARGSLTDSDIIYSLSGSDLTLNPGVDFILWQNKTYTPGGNLSSDDLVIQSNAVYNLQANSINISGNFSNSGTFNAGTGTVTFNGTSGIQTIDSGGTGAGKQFYNITINNSGTSVQLINNDLNQATGATLSFTRGTLDLNGRIWTLGADFSPAPVAAATLDLSTNGGGRLSGTGYDMTLANANMTIIQGAGTITCQDYAHSLGIHSISSGTINSRGFAHTGGAFTSSGASAINASGNVVIASAWTNSGSTITLSGSSQNLNASQALNNLTISGTISLLSNALNVDGNFRLLSGSFNANSLSQNFAASFQLDSGATYSKGGTLTFDGGVTQNFNDNAHQNIGTVIVTGASTNLNMQTGLACDELTIASGGKVTTGNNSLTVGIGGITINPGATLNATGRPTITLSAGFSNSGTFNAGTSTVTFNGLGASTISGSNTFYNLTSATAGKQLIFAAGATQTITGALTLTGASGNLIALRSSTTGTQWKIDPQGTMSVDYAEVNDSHNLNSIFIDPLHSSDNGNNNHWWTPVEPEPTPEPAPTPEPEPSPEPKPTPKPAASLEVVTAPVIERATQATDKGVVTIDSALGTIMRVIFEAPILGNMALANAGDASLASGRDMAVATEVTPLSNEKAQSTSAAAPAKEGPQQQTPASSKETKKTQPEVQKKAASEDNKEIKSEDKTEDKDEDEEAKE